MRVLGLACPNESLSILCLGAHSDDIEIGVGGTILSFIESGARLNVTWCVLSAPLERKGEAEISAASFLTGAVRSEVEICQFNDGYFPYQGSEVKAWMQGLARRVQPDVIFTHRGDDGHQDHRETSRLSWNCFRDSLILEYEIPKWDGDIGQPNMYSAISAKVLDRKVDLLMAAFGSQRSKDWFDPDVFRGLARLRGMECRAPERYAEAFVSRKMMFA